MAVTQRQKRQTVVNSASRKNAGRKKLSPAQKAAGFGGKRAKAAATRPKHRPKSKPKAAAVKARPAHRPRTAPKRATRPNLGKIISFSLPKESIVATTKKNKGRKPAKKSYKAATKKNAGRRHAARRNTGMGDVASLATSAVFTIAGAVGTKYLTQLALTTSNTGVFGYLGNVVSAFLLAWGTKTFLKNDRAAAAVLAGGFVQLVLRLITDYTPYGSYVANLGVGDYTAVGMGTYMPQNGPIVPQRYVDGLRSAQIQTYGGAGMAGCDALYSMNGGGLYS